MDYNLTLKLTLSEAELIRKALFRFATQHSQRVDEGGTDRRTIDAETSQAKQLADKIA